MIFANIQRQDLSSKLDGESEFSYLERSGRPEAAAVRSKLEQLVQEYPAADRRALLKNLQAELGFDAAFFELVVYSILKQQGYDLVPHPVLTTGPKRPDFLVKSKDGSEFYLEAKVATNLDVASRGKMRILQDILNALRRNPHPFFKVDVSWRGWPRSQPSEKRVVQDVHSWLNGIDVEEQRRGQFEPSIYEWEHESFRLVFKSRLLNESRVGNSTSLIGAVQFPMTADSTSRAIRDAVTSKGSKYGLLDKPLLVAVNSHAWWNHSEDDEEALFGDIQWRIGTSQSSSEDAEEVRLQNGAWTSRHGSRYTRVSGAWIFSNVCPWTLATRDSTLYFNPFATSSLPKNLEVFRHAAVRNNHLARHDGLGVREALELPLGWPEESRI